MATSRRLPLAVAPSVWRDVTLDPRILDALAKPSVAVAVGVSGGKDSAAVALAVHAYLERTGFQGPRILIHSDLGEVEWEDSLPTCQRIAAHIGWGLVVVRRQAGGMLQRWYKRWENNVARYTTLACVKLILPWSTASMRFCTSELKTDVICADLVKRFPGHTILSATGIRRDESTDRKNAPVSKAQPKLEHAKHRTTGYSWNAIADWELAQVLSYLEREAFPLHAAYTEHGVTRVSCAFCILGNAGDLKASAAVVKNQPGYLKMVDLEIQSAFSFKSTSWLGDVAPGLLSAAQRTGLARAKEIMAERTEIEKAIPKHLLYVKNWPTQVPTYAEAVLLARVRTQIGKLQGFAMQYTEPSEIQARYRELLAIKDARQAKGKKKSTGAAQP